MNYIEYISEYLDKDLSDADAIRFEQALTTDEALQKALAQEQAIRQQFEYEAIRQKASALHEFKETELAQDTAIAAQFEYEQIRQKALALRERKKVALASEEEKQAHQAKIIPLYRRIMPYAMAASIAGLIMFGYWNMGKQSIENEVVINPIFIDTIKTETPIVPLQKIDKEEVVGKIKSDNQVEKHKVKRGNLKEERLASTNPLFDENATDIVLNDFCKDELKDMNMEVMGSENEKSAATFLKKGQYNEAEELLLAQTEKNDDTFFLLALVAIKKKENQKAIKFLQGIKKKSNEVKEVLEKVGF